MKIIGIIQARMGSSRLPGKVLMDLCGRPMVIRLWERLSLATLDGICLVTSTNPENDVLVKEASRVGLPAVRTTPESDVIGMLRAGAEQFGADAIVRVTADCPLVSPQLVDALVAEWGEWNPPWWDYLSNVWPRRTYPDGLDLELFSRPCLDRLSAVIPENDPRRSTPNVWIWDHHVGFRIGFMPHTEDLSWVRWTVDRRDDLERLRRIWAELPLGFRWEDVPTEHWFREETRYYQPPRPCHESL